MCGTDNKNKNKLGGYHIFAFKFRVTVIDKTYGDLRGALIIIYSHICHNIMKKSMTRLFGIHQEARNPSGLN